LIQFEQAYRNYKNSWKTTMLSLLITGVLFGTLSTTPIRFDREPKEDSPELTFYIPPPPETESENQVPLPADLEKNFQFEFTEPQTSMELPLDFIDVPLGPTLDPELSNNIKFKPDLQAKRPSANESFIVFERNQVDQDVEPIYIPPYNLPYHLRPEGGELFVLYRVTPKGRTENIHILTTSNPEINPYAVRLLERVRFRPAKKEGQPVGIWVQHILRFKKGSSSPFQLN